MLTGAWAGAQDVFLGQMDGGSVNCFPPSGPPDGEPTPSWLLKVAGYRSLGSEKILVDRSENTLARLVPGGKPKLTPDVAASQAEPPVVTDEDRAELTAKPQVSAPLTRLERKLVVGRWVPTANGAAAYVEFKDDGSWVGSDGCNGNRGRWAASADSMVATGGPSTLIGCEGAPVPGWVSSTAVAALAGDLLVLIDAKGAELARLKKG
jgi:heat shock protein HslJ